MQPEREWLISYLNEVVALEAECYCARIAIDHLEALRIPLAVRVIHRYKLYTAPGLIPFANRFNGGFAGESVVISHDVLPP